MRTKVLSTLRSLANAILGRLASRILPDAATRMAQDADFQPPGEPPTPKLAPAQKVDQIAELMRDVGAQGKEPSHRSKLRTLSRHRRRHWGCCPGSKSTSRRITSLQLSAGP